MTDPLSTQLIAIPAEGESLSQHGNSKKGDYKINVETGCWEWQKTKSDRGYGRVSVNGKGAWAYRAYYEVAYGPIPPDHDIHHKCNNPSCVNPEHLEAMHFRDHDVQAFLTERANGLTLDDVKEIRRLGRIQGYTSKGVAETFGIHWRTVDDYWGSRRWALEFDDGPCRPVCLCPVCDGTFVAEKHRRQRYCSESCKRKANRKARSRCL